MIKMNSSSVKFKFTCPNIFARYGIPHIVVAYNRPFDSYEIRDLANQQYLQIQTESPSYPQANRLAEKGMGVAKNLLKTSLESGIYLKSLFNYQNCVLLLDSASLQLSY